MRQTPSQLWAGKNRALDIRHRWLEVAAALIGAAMVWGASQSIRPAAGQQVQIPQCNARDAMLADLAGKFGEKPVAGGPSSKGLVLEVTASASGSWTIIATNPGGITCIMESGLRWRALPTAPVGDPS